MANQARSTGGNQSFRKNPEYVNARRAIVREHHPDHGGSNEALIAELKKLDERWERKTAFSAALREQFQEHRPSFIDPKAAEQAIQFAERYADPVVSTADYLVERGEKGGKWLKEKGQGLYESKVPPKVKQKVEKTAQDVLNRATKRFKTGK